MWVVTRTYRLLQTARMCKLASKSSLLWRVLLSGVKRLSVSMSKVNGVLAWCALLLTWGGKVKPLSASCYKVLVKLGALPPLLAKAHCFCAHLPITEMTTRSIRPKQKRQMWVKQKGVMPRLTKMMTMSISRLVQNRRPKAKPRRGNRHRRMMIMTNAMTTGMPPRRRRQRPKPKLRRKKPKAGGEEKTMRKTKTWMIASQQRRVKTRPNPKCKVERGKQNGMMIVTTRMKSMKLRLQSPRPRRRRKHKERKAGVNVRMMKMRRRICPHPRQKGDEEEESKMMKAMRTRFRWPRPSLKKAL
mmetsp:Transcript_97538/g.244461  ORF Transcript_97538/g.244461 Transcript_97538/m.244461 type:complete len:301 (-) Transcript_97538:924-1826(-)